MVQNYSGLQIDYCISIKSKAVNNKIRGLDHKMYFKGTYIKILAIKKEGFIKFDNWK